MISQIGFLTQSNLKLLKELLQKEETHFDSDQIKSLLDKIFPEKKKVEKDKLLGSAMSSMSKFILEDDVPLLIPWSKVKRLVNRVRKGKEVKIERNVQLWKVNDALIKNKKEVLKTIEEILATS